MSDRYVEISFEEFDQFMGEHGFNLANPDSKIHEYVYRFEWAAGAYLIQVYSSITPMLAVGRGLGEDAIRVSLLVETSPFKMVGVWQAPRTYRVKNWRENILPKIEEAKLRGCFNREDYECKICGAPMFIKEGRRGFFYGCVNYKDQGCTYTFDYNEDSNLLTMRKD